MPQSKKSKPTSLASDQKAIRYLILEAHRDVMQCRDMLVVAEASRNGLLQLMGRLPKKITWLPIKSAAAAKALRGGGPFLTKLKGGSLALNAWDAATGWSHRGEVVTHIAAAPAASEGFYPTHYGLAVEHKVLDVHLAPFVFKALP